MRQVWERQEFESRKGGNLIPSTVLNMWRGKKELGREQPATPIRGAPGCWAGSGTRGAGQGAGPGVLGRKRDPALLGRSHNL